MEKIDFVVPWVNGGDENWVREKQKYTVYRSRQFCKPIQRLGKSAILVSRSGEVCTVGS